MKLKSTISIQFRLVLLVVACLLPALVAVVMFLYYEYLRGRAEFIREAISTSRSFRYGVDEIFARTESSLQALATSPHLKNKDYAAFHQQAQTLVRGTKTGNILLIGADGQIVMDSAKPFEQQQPKVINQAQLERVLRLGYPDISGIFTDPQSGKPLVNVAVPVHAAEFGNATTHSLVGRIPMEQF